MADADATPASATALVEKATPASGGAEEALNGVVVRDPALPAPTIAFDGERYVPGAGGAELELEHVHRYLFAAPFCAGKAVLDIASGEGYGSHILAQRAASVVGVDIDAETVAAAKVRYARDNLTFRVGGCEAIPLDDASVDAVVSYETIEHIHGHGAFLDECRRVLRPGGLLVVSTPDEQNYNHDLDHANEHHVHELERAEFEALLRARFRHVRLLGQRVTFGSLIVAPGEERGQDRFTSISYDATTGESRAQAHADRTIYWIALCSDAALPAADAGLFEGALPPNAMSSVLGGIAERDRRIFALADDLDGAREAVETAALAKAAAVAIAEQSTAQAHAIHAQLLAEIGEKNEAAGIARARFDQIEDLKEQLRGAHHRADAARTTLHTTTSALETVTATLQTALSAVARAQADSADLRTRIEDVQRERDALVGALAHEQRRIKNVIARAVARAERGVGKIAALGGRAVRTISSPARMNRAARLAVKLTRTPPSRIRAVIAAERTRSADLALLRGPGGVDAAYYLAANPDVARAGLDAAEHYLQSGGAELRAPNRTFSPRDYLRRHPDVAASGVDPLLHFLRHGRTEGRDRIAEPPRPPAPVAIRPATIAPEPERQVSPRRWPIPTRRESAPDPFALRGPYERRPDELVPLEAALGEAFLAAHALQSLTPNFSGAVAALNAMGPHLPIRGPFHPAPDASIIIPVWGQLAYTLNCLHALLAHTTRRTVEIIVVDDCSPDETGAHIPCVNGVRYLGLPENVGFVGACNAGAAAARGATLIFLNNDTRVLAGWLDEMLDTFVAQPDAGLVGSKLFYPDGTLQEAGGLIWRDGSAWNYGRNDDPNRPEYCYAREVDYVSGAAIAVPADLWRALNGFDTLYRPAYCEDSDLAMRVRHVARRGVWMQPHSRVIHYEGKTSGTDLTKGAKAYQVVNAEKFRARWRDVLALHRAPGDAPRFEKDRTRQKRALVIDACTPTPDQDAGSVTAFVTMSLLQDEGYKVSFIPQDNVLFMPPYSGDLQRIGIEPLYAPFTPSIEHHLAEHGADYDVVLVIRVDVAAKVMDLIDRYAPQAATVFYNMDLHYLRMAREAELTGSADAIAAAEKMKATELRMMARFDCNVIHSPLERDLLLAERADLALVLTPFVTDCAVKAAPIHGRSYLMFLGGYRHRPNVDAVAYFAEEIWPLILKDAPDAKFVAVGAHPPPELLALQTDNFSVTGHVDDLEPWLAGARVMAAPLRYGAGVKGKISTAMAHGLPVVGSSIALEGMGIESPRDAIAADDPATFAAACVRLLKDDAAWQTLADNGLRFARENNSLEAGARNLRDAIAIAKTRHRERLLRQAS